jgi:protoporphyrinogen/coproporphyrinogen III oxidase
VKVSGTVAVGLGSPVAFQPQRKKIDREHAAFIAGYGLEPPDLIGTALAARTKRHEQDLGSHDAVTQPSAVAVLGAGISGLTVAHALAAAGHDFVIIDGQHAVGGRIHTEKRDGFLVEQGPTCMISPAPRAESLIAALGLTDERVQRSERVRRRYLVRDGRAHALPLSPLPFFCSGFFSLAARLRLLAEPFIGTLDADESVADFVRRRFGPELLDYVFDPLVGGLYAGVPQRLSVTALFPQLKRMERQHGSVIRGVLKARAAGCGGTFDPRRRMLFSFRAGMVTLPRALAQRLGDRLRLGVRIQAIEPCAGGGYRLQVKARDVAGSIRVANVIVALPAYAAARALAPLAHDTAAALNEVDHPPLAVVALGYRDADVTHALDGLGVLAPSIEKRSALGMLFSSTLFAGRAPEGHVLLTAYVGGARQPELALLPRERLVNLVHHEVRALLGGRGEPVFSSVRYWRQSLPQPDLSHARRIAALRTLEDQWPGLFVTGNYVSGVSTVACIDSALTTAERAVAHFTRVNGLREAIS